MAFNSGFLRHASRALLAGACVLGVAAARIQSPSKMPGYSETGADAERRVEAAAIALPSAESAGVYARALSREPHMSGTPAQARTRDYVIERMRSWGLETSVRAYQVWMPHPTSVRVWRVSPDARELSLAEGPISVDSTSALPEVPAINGYEVCRRARAQPWGGDATFIALTGWGQEEDRRRTQEAGFDSHLVKPVEFGALVTQLNALGAMRKA